MSARHYLSSLFSPQSLAVVGASEREHSVGGAIFANILNGGFRGRLYPVNPKHASVFGQAAVPTLEAIGARVDLAIIATPARTVPALIEQCARAGIGHALIVATGFAESGASGALLERRVREIARANNVRILGPNCLGILRPEQKLNAAYTRIGALPGDLALVSQSGAMCSAVMDWAAGDGLGFSSVISLGGTLDLDFGEVLDYLVHDERTRHILLYVERIRNARSFMSALRAAARIKPVILLKSGRHDFSPTSTSTVESQRNDFSDPVFDAAVRRAGVVRVQNIDQLFHAAKALASGFRPRGKQLAIISNGGGPGAMAADRAGDLGIPLATLTGDTGAQLDRLLPRGWQRGSCIDLGGDASPERYRDAILAVANDPHVHCVLVMLAPHAASDPQAIAEALIAARRQTRTALSACWMGGGLVAAARQQLAAAGIPVFATPDMAIELFHNIAKYHRNQKLLLQTPGPGQARGVSRPASARHLVEALLAERRKQLSPMEAQTLLRTFGIPAVQTLVAHSASEAMFIAEQIGLPVSMQINSPDIADAEAAGGVRLNLDSCEAVAHAWQDIVGAVGKRHPEARIAGVSLAAQVERPQAHAIRLGARRDPVFGPVIALTGNAHPVGGEPALALPPLNAFLARDLIQASSLQALPDLNHGALEKILAGVSELLCELPWIAELAIEPLLLDANGALAVNTRIVIDHALAPSGEPYRHLAIHPYPAHLTQQWLIDGKTIKVRPVRPEDANLEQEFTRAMSEESRFFRFMDHIRELPPSLLVRFTQIDYDREMAFIATEVDANGREQQIGSVRYAQTPDGESVDFALAIADAWQRCGLGRRLMTLLIDCARQRGYRAMIGDILADNPKMLKLVEGLGFSLLPHPDDRSCKRVVKPLLD